MPVSVFDLFTIGIGPSSSHTVGPMRAARRFARRLRDEGLMARTAQVRVELYGSLGATGKGHGTDKAVVLGLMGEEPERVDPEAGAEAARQALAAGRLRLLGRHEIPFVEGESLVFHRRRRLPFHPNGMRFEARDAAGARLAEAVLYSVGGGFVVAEGEQGGPAQETRLPYPFTSAETLLGHCAREGLAVSDVMWANERVWRTDAEIRAGLLRIWEVMQACVRRGCERDGVLPGGMKVRRRAPELHRKLVGAAEGALRDPLNVLDWVDLYALAVSEENAAGGRVVTAPTNGAAGIVPAVLHYATRFGPDRGEEGVIRFLLTAGAIGLLYKLNASISGADVGCQGEVGVACSMAAGALAEYLGGTPQQVENAAEIGMEHNLGLTCDPVGGLVQVPCIERNAMGAVKAINAARLALRGDGRHHVSLDRVIRTMRETGADMSAKYKETARGGLAVNVIEC
ncbi:L-serine ammonia-lyase [Inmirania thermothiophila]|uniref:L-serine dehydratase n=1 Tax=Inmirania thermothiophila TaxID=1750597 RepID=A0A3N1Y1Q1_9GAMM|nr:L-serine ammonia-lyase [Inmirania thermothiophila]ROR32451.1 L-serine ammonia-lyase [Inmirania thermothiophila]